MTAHSIDANTAGIEGSEPPLPHRLAKDCELLGQYEGSAFEQPQYLLRRRDGQVLQVSRLLYSVATYLDGTRDTTQIAERVSADLGRTVSADNVGYLVRHKLEPIGLVTDGGTDPAPAPRASPLLTLRFRTKLLPERFHRGSAIALRPLFWPPAIATVLAGLVALDGWLAATQGPTIFRQTRQVIVHPLQFLLLNGLVIAACVFHEFGHATAARYGGATPGAMGVGIYLAFPVFYTDVTDSYRLDRRGRLRTDLGGVYFNAFAIVVAGAAYLATGFKPLLVFVVVSQLQVLYQFLPTVRMDGYYVVSDLIGVPNLFAFIRPVAAHLLRRSQGAHGRLGQLKPRARIAVSVWVCLTVPILLVNVGFFAAVAPRVLPALWSATRRQEHVVCLAVAHGEVIKAVNGVIGLIVLIVTGTGLLLTGALILTRIGRLAVRYAAPRCGRLTFRTAPALLAATVGLICLALLALASGAVKQEPVLVDASVVCTVLAALTLASFALVSGGTRPTDSAKAGLRAADAAPSDSGRGSKPRVKGSTKDAEPGLPIERYDQLRVAEILPRLRELGTDEFQRVRAYEAQRRARVTILAKIDALIEKAEDQVRPARLDRQPVPIEGYDNLTVAKILPLLSRLRPEGLDAIAERERSGAGRRTVLSRISSLQQRPAIRR